MPEVCIPAEKCSPAPAALGPPGCIPQAAPQDPCPGSISVKKSLSWEPPGRARQSPCSCTPEGLFPSNPQPRAQLEIHSHLPPLGILLPGRQGTASICVCSTSVYVHLCVSLSMSTPTLTLMCALLPSPTRTPISHCAGLSPSPSAPPHLRTCSLSLALSKPCHCHV